MAQKRKSSLNKRTVHYPGKVDLTNFGKGPVKWLTIQQRGTREIVMFFGYETPTRFIGIRPADMVRAPCTHCGQTPFATYTAKSQERPHVCPGFIGRDSVGYEVPCANGTEAHVCTGQPSMSWHGVSHWLRPEWEILNYEQYHTRND